MKNKGFQLATVIIGLFVITGCFPKKSTQSLKVEKPSSAPKHILSPKQYYVDTDGDGVFEKVTLDEKPVLKDKQRPIIKYPVSARENGIQGKVILSIFINKNGDVQSITVKKGLSKDCDAEAKKMLMALTKKGFTPAKYKNMAVKCQIEWTVGFWLE